MLSIATIRYENAAITARFHTYVKCRRTIPGQIADLTGIDNAFLATHGADLKDALTQFMEFCGDSDLIAIHSAFQKQYLDRDCIHSGLPVMQNKIIDIGVLYKEITGKTLTPRERKAYTEADDYEKQDPALRSFRFMESIARIYLSLQKR